MGLTNIQQVKAIITANLNITNFKNMQYSTLINLAHQAQYIQHLRNTNNLQLTDVLNRQTAFLETLQNILLGVP